MSTSANRFFTEPAKKYHAWSGQYLSSHLLMAAHESISEWRKLMSTPREDSPAYAFGRAVHTLCLEGKAVFDAEYIVGGPVNPRTNKTYGHASKKFQAWAVGQSREAITPEQFAMAYQMTKKVHANKAASQLLEKGEPELVARTEYCGLPCQIRTDWLTQGKWIADLKSTSDLFSFGTSVEQYGYMYQAAFYQAIAEQVTGEKLGYYLIASEKSDEANCIVWKLSQEKLDEHRAKNEQKIDEIRHEFLRINANRPDLSVIEQSVEEYSFYQKGEEDE